MENINFLFQIIFSRPYAKEIIIKKIITKFLSTRKVKYSLTRKRIVNISKINIIQPYTSEIFLSTRGKCIKYSTNKKIPNMWAITNTKATLPKYENNTNPSSKKGSANFKIEYLDFS